MGGIAWYANYILKKLFRGTISRSSLEDRSGREERQEMAKP